MLYLRNFFQHMKSDDWPTEWGVGCSWYWGCEGEHYRFSASHPALLKLMAIFQNQLSSTDMVSHQQKPALNPRVSLPSSVTKVKYDFNNKISAKIGENWRKRGYQERSCWFSTDNIWVNQAQPHLSQNDWELWFINLTICEMGEFHFWLLETEKRKKQWAYLWSPVSCAGVAMIKYHQLGELNNGKVWKLKVQDGAIGRFPFSLAFRWVPPMGTPGSLPSESLHPWRILIFS